MNPYYKHLETLIDNRAGTSHGSQTNNGSSCLQMFFKFRKFFESLFNEVAGPNFVKERSQHSCFPVKFAKFLRAPFFTEHHLELVPGHEPVKIAKEIMYISAAITNKVHNILEKSFFSILSNGSQARKTKLDKEVSVDQNRKKRYVVINWFDHFSVSQSKLLLARNALPFSESFVLNLSNIQMRYFLITRFFKH